MLLLEPGHTPYDLHFRVFGIPVRVHPMFWLVGAIMGFSRVNEPQGLTLFAIWMVSVFVSILIHELGHVVMGQICGSNGHIVLYAFGGLAVGSNNLEDRWQRIAVLFAGPLAGFIFAGLVVAGLALIDLDKPVIALRLILDHLGVPTEGPIFLGLDPLVEQIVEDLLFINVFWGLMNLLPIWPLDGGQIARELFDAAMPGGQGVRVALGISLVLAGVLAVHCIAATRGARLLPFLPALGGAYTALMFGMLAVQSYLLLQQQSHPPWRRDDW